MSCKCCSNKENSDENTLDLTVYGIHDVKEIFHNLSYEELFKHETNPELQGFEKGYLTNTGAITVDTGIFTGRSPKDKYIVKEVYLKKIFGGLVPIVRFG